MPFDNVFLIAAAWVGLALLASLISIRLGISVALIEILVGVVAGNLTGLTSHEWIDFLAAFGAVLLTFLAGADERSGIVAPPPAHLARDRARCRAQGWRVRQS